MNTFHINGMTNYISRFLLKYQNIEYEEFYEKFFQHIQKDPWLNGEIKRIRDHYGNWSRYGKIDHIPIENIEIHGWNLVHSTIINMHSQGKRSYIFNIIEDFVRTNFNLDNELINQLMKFQSNYIVDYAEMSTYPKKLNFDYDFLGYIINDTELIRSTDVKFDFPEDKTQSLQRFCEQIFFARRRNFGKSWIERI
jgi:hypothetical protein